MSRLLAALALLCAYGLPAQVTFRSSTERVVVPVSVVSQGRPVTGLMAQDFQLLDNGVIQTIESASQMSGAVDVTVIAEGAAVDHSLTAPMFLGRRDREASSFSDWIQHASREIGAFLKPGDSLEFINASGGVARFDPAAPGPIRGTVASNESALLDALSLVIIRPSTFERRRLILALSNGFDTLSIISPDIRTRIARSGDSAVYLFVAARGQLGAGGSRVSVAGRVTSAQVIGDASWILRDLAESTGGQFVQLLPTESPTARMKQIVNDFRQSYLLTYAPTGVDASGWHTLSVKVQGRNRSVLHRRGYERVQK